MVPALARLRAWWPLLLALTLVGAVAGAAVASQAPVYKSTKVSILLAQPPVYLSPDSGSDASSPGDVTIDTEAALVIARQSLSRVVGNRDTTALDELRKRVRVTAAPNTTVLSIEVKNKDAQASQAEAEALARSYLVTRRDYLLKRRDQALELLRRAAAPSPPRNQPCRRGAGGGQPGPAGAGRHHDPAHSGHGRKGDPDARARRRAPSARDPSDHGCRDRTGRRCRPDGSVARVETGPSAPAEAAMNHALRVQMTNENRHDVGPA